MDMKEAGAKVKLIKQLQEAAKSLTDNINVEIDIESLQQLNWELDILNPCFGIYLRATTAKNEEGEHLLELLRIGATLDLKKIIGDIDHVEFNANRALVLYARPGKSELRSFWKMVKVLSPLDITNKRDVLLDITKQKDELDERRDSLLYTAMMLRMSQYRNDAPHVANSTEDEK